MARPRAHRHLAELLAETRRLCRRNRRRIDPHVRAEILAVQTEAGNALASGDEARIVSATAALQAAADRHLAHLRTSLFREAGEMVLVAVLLAVVVRLFVVEAFRIPSGSMVPTLLPGDVVLVAKSSYGLRLPGGRVLLPGAAPQRGDVVVFASPTHPGQDLIKRVAGLPGDVIELVDEQVRVDGVPQPRVQVADRYEFWNHRDDLRYWHPQSGHVFLEELGGRRHLTLHSRLLPRPRPSEGPFVVPPGHLFVLGDNRDESADGRSDGGWYVPLDAVKGRAVLVWYSWGRDGSWPWGEGGLRPSRLFRSVDGEVRQHPLPLDEVAASLRGRWEAVAAEPDAAPALVPSVERGDGAGPRGEGAPPAADDDGPAETY